MDIRVEAPNLLRRYKEGAAFRKYVQRRTPVVVAALVVFLLFGAATTAAMVVFFAGTSSLAALACLIVAPFVLIGSLFVQTFVFFSWLERRAINRAAPGLPEIPWTLAALFLGLPFFVLALVSIKVAVTVLVIAVLMPVAYAYLDQ
ncbi:MAG TPA: hypothetical protein VM183_14910 [Burkholderiales bacterium]|nr:hypothetical protein [Burkholderiales bacterium]